MRTGSQPKEKTNKTRLIYGGAGFLFATTTTLSIDFAMNRWGSYKLLPNYSAPLTC